MKRLKYLLSSSIYLVLLFSFVLFFIESANAQQVNKVFEDIGGGGSANNSVDEGSDNTMYIVGGAIIVGILVYALLRDKKDTAKQDTTAVANNKNLLVQSPNYETEISVGQSQIPVNIFLGLQNEKAFREDKRYILGVSYNF